MPCQNPSTMPNPAAEFLLRLQPVATSTGFHSTVYGTIGDDDLVVLNRPGRAGGPHIYVSAGIHGDDPAGPEALIRLLGEFSLLPDATWTLFPMLNPSGYRRGTRENADGLDLNRDYRHPTAAETRAHRAVLDQLGNLDLTLSLHEDWESPGFYLYELNATDSEGIATDALKAAGLEGPIDLSPEIDGRPASGGIVHAPVERFDQRTDWPEQIHLFKTRTKLCYTFETPSALPLEVRVRMHVAACRSALQRFCAIHG